MIRLSIRRKIMGIAVALIVLMAITSVMTVVLVMQVGTRIEELTYNYMPAYGDLARANIRSLERALAIRRIIIEKLQSPDDNGQYMALRNRYDALGGQVELEILAARALIHGLIENGPAFGDASTLSQFETRIDAINDDSRRRLNAENDRLLAVLDTGNAKALAEEMERIDELRDDLNRKLDSVRANMLALVRKDANMTVERQHQVMLISVVLTALAAILGLVFAGLVSAGVTRPVRRLLEGARAVEAGDLQGTLVATSRDEIGHLTTAFNQMVEQLRLKERLRETFGKYVDPRVVEGLIQGPALAAEGQRRVMTVLFCDVKGFTSTSEGMTPQGLVKVMNRTFRRCPRRSAIIRGSSTNISATLSWPIGDRPSPPTRSRRGSPAWRRWRCCNSYRSCGPSCPNCSAFARFRTRSISASASPPARCWSAASGPS